jgi:glycosyltransferase A (GT-A) superfamily protein (DUF2064 family)
VRGRAVVVAGDAPGIEAEAIVAAASSPADVVLGPTRDGGFGLIRMRRPRPEIFAGIRWSTGSVLDQTVAACRAAGLTVALLGAIADVDTVDDLGSVDLSRARATRAVLANADVGPPTRPAGAGR